ncbi:NifB/NifX family molybdenum-iron cluster-binding protein [Rubrivivax benzoatilyticus]|uniref:Dinitrogenase iron-molybdenum cofactor biosynthesis domain-containing protein n=1 Tax=Rubrivivax benzoatilyticus TaxID=316997 RepID=A0ABX0HYI6_9BURK|nr:hypothetical protein [Rubrivivax benzoatilyticus]EGJ10398.1 hypothetical protein RBXJA2T_08730 [Rubrivivax benzoatilyticus JA2 = ATCC BAA-35]NHK98409.1 hypothetical protein [Rubrivivax benzoatilyticus]NHL23816.1 hypothetical protein [Rubrivivax benzoatilyticus]
MRIAVAVDENAGRIAGHAGQCRHWLVYECRAGQPLPQPQTLELSREQLPHHFRDDGPHPLRGCEMLVVGSAGDGFVRHMASWGAEVVRTGESDPRRALERLIAGDPLPDTRPDVTRLLCKLRDVFSRH